MAPRPIEPIFPVTATKSTWRAALDDHGFVMHLPRVGRRVICRLPLTGAGVPTFSIVSPEPNGSDEREADLLMLALAGQTLTAISRSTPALNDAVFDGVLCPTGRGVAFDPRVAFDVLDLLVYRGEDLRTEPFSARLAILTQAFAELRALDQLDPSWTIVAALVGPAKTALFNSRATSLRNLRSPYRPGVSDAWLLPPS